MMTPTYDHFGNRTSLDLCGGNRFVHGACPTAYSPYSLQGNHVVEQVGFARRSTGFKAIPDLYNGGLRLEPLLGPGA